MSHYYDKNTKCDICGEYFSIFDLNRISDKLSQEEIKFLKLNTDIKDSYFICDKCNEKFLMELEFLMGLKETNK